MNTDDAREQSQLWRCDWLRAGRLYESKIFPTKEAADTFAKEMTKRLPDQFFKVEAVMARQVWN